MENSIFQTILFSDLDDTLIQTKRKTDFTRNTIVAATNRQGENSSYIYKETKDFLDGMIKQGIELIPVTARNLSAYKRTFMENTYSPKYAVLNFGGTILVNGEVDMDWDEKIKKEYAHIPSFSMIKSQVVSRTSDLDVDINVSIVDDFYISVNSPTLKNDKKVLSFLKKTIKDIIEFYPSLHIYESDNSFAILPNCISKRRGVEYLISKLEPTMTIGAGDNINDLSFMDCCTFKIIPTNSLVDNHLLRGKESTL